MHPQMLLPRVLCALLACVFLVSAASAQDTLLVNYQGRLTDDIGDPITGTPSMTFVIYDGSGPSALSKWSETHASVPVTDGLFNVILGSVTALPDSVFNGDDRYLGISVGGDLEISPRIPLTDAPYAAYAKKMIGDIETGKGMLVMKDSNGDSVIVLSSGAGRSTGMIYMIDPVDKKELLTMTSAHSTGTDIKLIDPVDKRELLTLSGSPTSGASMRMFNPQPEPPAVLLEMNANATDGAGMNIYDDIGQVMGFDPSPFNSGYSIKLIDPVDEKKLAEMHSSYGAKGGSGEVAVYDTDNSLESHLTPAKLVLEHTPGMISYPSIVLDATSADDPRIGIGTATPSEPLVVGDDLTYFASGNMITVGDAGATNFAGISFGQNADNRGWMVYDNENDYISFGTKEDGVFAPNKICMKNGDLGIGTSTPGEDLHVVGDICYTGTIGTCSDIRYKKNISTLTNILGKISRLRGVKFNWNRDEFPENEFTDKEQVGLIAQEVMEIFPQVVSQDGNGYYNIDYTKFAPLLINAVKELKAENNELRERIEALENR